MTQDGMSTNRASGTPVELVKHVMTRPVIGIAPAATLYEATRLIVDRRISGLPVIDATGYATALLSSHGSNR